MEGKVTTSIENKIGTISFYHPKSNSLPGSVLNELVEDLTQISAIAALCLSTTV